MYRQLFCNEGEVRGVNGMRALINEGGVSAELRKWRFVLKQGSVGCKHFVLFIQLTQWQDLLKQTCSNGGRFESSSCALRHDK